MLRGLLYRLLCSPVDILHPGSPGLPMGSPRPPPLGLRGIYNAPSWVPPISPWLPMRPQRFPRLSWALRTPKNGYPQAPCLILRPYFAWATRPPRRRENAQHAQPTGPKQKSLLCIGPVRFILGIYMLLAKAHAAHRPNEVSPGNPLAPSQIA